MSGDPYSQVVRNYFANTPHAGELADAIAVEIAEQGVRLRLAAMMEDGRIRALRFRVWGCPHVIAACECFCADYEGKPVESLSGFQASNIMRNLSVPVEKTGRILVLEDAVRSLGRVLCSDSAPQ